VEKDIKMPILQVASGQFTKQHKGLSLAVLSTRELTIHSITSTKAFSQIQMLQQHKLERNAFNFVQGLFGNQGSNQQIIIQSVDGALIVIDDEFILFKIQLADYFIPGPFNYSSNSNLVILANSKLQVECYSYESLKIFTNNDIVK